ncbi:PREDICTED: structural maintenance of chromosomes protein 5 [Tarenaya hassleriana]|uniref:structural maintenance of chromosomes protein 5 n=1 Tax=Tarenaya hassleriana TaxID=28532 RepID=UPI00053C93C0|nr:PREDICTED: structural maintenance of chromosomes protein 5 [Tarenaya hassleriana]
MEERRAKRPKIARGEDDYLPGNIIEIELHNFMTFNHLVCKPGSRLNLVIGPNGSGKSSLVCAIALCLGGEPQLLGRATSVGAYVKRGEESGYIKILLRGNAKEEEVTIVRKIDTRNKSEWMFNGKLAAKREITEIIQRFNIQVNNLTQFLPQDRVCEFAKLTPVQLLEETEKAVGDPGLPVQHRALVEKSRELKQLERAVEKNGETLNLLKGLNDEQERDVVRIRQRDLLLKKVESMKKKLPWLKYDMKKAEYVDAKKHMNEASKKLDEAAKALNNIREPIEKQKQEKAEIDSKCKMVKNMLDENSRKRCNILEKEDQAEAHVRAKYKEVEQLKKQEENRQERILKAKEDLVAAEQELENLPVYQPPKAELEKMSAQVTELQFNINQKKNQRVEKERLLSQKRHILRQCMDKLKDMENANNKLLTALRNSGAERIFDAYQWVQQHRHEFRKEVYGPVLLEVNVSNREHASYLEGHVPYFIWKSFITQDSDDRDLLVRNLRPFDVPVLNFVDDGSYRKTPFRISDEMRMLGIHSRLDQIFDAPTAVKEVLTSQFGLDDSYIGSKDTDQRAEEVSNLRIHDFWTPDNHYRWSTSRYGGHVSASVEPVHPSRLLLCGVDVGEIEKLRSRKDELEESVSSIEESVKSIQLEQRLLEEEAAKLHRQREEVMNVVHLDKRKRRDLENRVDQRKKKLQSLDQEEDLDSSVSKLIEQACRANVERYRYAINLKKLLIEAAALKWSYAEKHMASIELERKIRESELNIKQYEKTAQQASVNLEYCKKEVEGKKQQLSAAKRHAESIAVITPELREEFIEMPTTIEELEAAIQDNVSQANSILLLNQNVLQEYEHRQRQIGSIATKLEADKKDLSKCLEDIDSLKERWLATLRRLVAQINETFSRNFQEMAVAGEVSLDEHGTDFDQYGILIKVKFRESGQLQVLSSHHQSGGERSVSTILYLVSLQDLTHCPFRVVDEINQGMDPINERKMFQQLVRAASQPNTPQCFLLTPKLLPELDYSEACSILNIMNGPWIEQPSKVWSSGDSWGNLMRTAEASRCS